MKKIGLFCAVILACGSLTACGNQSSSNSKKDSSISSLKAENSSLKAKKDNSHRIKRHRSSNSNQAKDGNGNSGSSASQTAKSNSLNGVQTTKSSSIGQNEKSGQKVANQSKSGSDNRTGDWHNDPDLWADVQNNDNWQGSMYQNATPQERYNYLEDNHDYWAARDPNYYSGNQFISIQFTGDIYWYHDFDFKNN